MEENKNIEMPESSTSEQPPVNVSPLLAEFQEEPVVTNDAMPKVVDEAEPVAKGPVITPIEQNEVSEPETEFSLPSSPVIEAPISNEPEVAPIEAPAIEMPTPPVETPVEVAVPDQSSVVPSEPVAPVVTDSSIAPVTPEPAPQAAVAPAPIENPVPVESAPAVSTPSAPAQIASPTVPETPVVEQKDEVSNEPKKISKKAQIIGTTIVLIIAILLVIAVLKSFHL